MAYFTAAHLLSAAIVILFAVGLYQVHSHRPFAVLRLMVNRTLPGNWTECSLCLARFDQHRWCAPIIVDQVIACRCYALGQARLVELSGGNRQQINNTTDERTDDCTVYTDVLKVAAKDQFETVGYSPRIPVPHDFQRLAIQSRCAIEATVLRGVR